MSRGDEDFAFEERVRRSREAARRGWMLATVLWFGLPGMVVTGAVLLAQWTGSTYVSLGAALLTSILVVAGIEIARRVWRRPPT